MDVLATLAFSLADRYEFVRELGGGGMSRIFLARELALDRAVVVKVLPPELAADISDGRFAREITLAASLQQANVVPVLSSGSADGLSYYIMPYVAGESLRHRLATGTLEINTAVSILRDVARALAYAHGHGVVHRDIKPDNVLLSGETAVVTDFGIAKALTAAAGAPPSNGTLTVAGTSVGTPAYMAPEQAAGDPNTDHRADIYSFGCLAYELLTGAPPFAGTPQQLFAAHITEVPVSVRTTRPDVPRALADLVARCLEKDPERRPPSAAELLPELERERTALPRSLSNRPRLRLVVAGVTAVVVALLAARAAGFWPVFGGTISTKEPLLIADFSVTGADSSLGAVVSDAVRAALAQSPTISLLAPASVAATLRRMERPATARLDLALARDVAQRQGAKAVIDGSVARAGSSYIVTVRLISADSGAELRTYRATGDGSRGLIDATDEVARDVRRSAGESLRSVRGTPPLEQVTTRSLEALRYQSAAVRAQTAEGDYFKAVRMARQAVAVDSTFSSAWLTLYVALRNAQMPVAAAESALTQAFRHRDRLTERERQQVQASYYNTVAHDRAKALAAYTAMLEGGDSSVLVTLGQAYAARREFSRAESLNMAALRRRPDDANPYLNVIQARVNLGRRDDAARMADDAHLRFPDNPTVTVFGIQVMYHQGKLADYERRVDSVRTANDRRSVDWGLCMSANNAQLHGRIAEWRQLARDCRAALADQGAASPALLDVANAVTNELWLRGPSHALVAQLDASVAKYPFAGAAPIERPYGEVATAYAMLGESAKARGIMARYDAEVRDTTLRRVLESRVHQVLGEIAIAEHRPLDALAEFRRGDTTYDGRPTNDCAACLPLQLARAFDAGKERDSAVAYYERYLATPRFEKPEEQDPRYLAMVYRRLGELAGEGRDVRRASLYYGRFVELWKSASPELQPIIAMIQRRAAGPTRK